MPVIEQWIKTDLNTPIQIVEAKGCLFSDDNLSNLFGVEIYQNGSPVTNLSGYSVIGYAIRSDGGTLTITGRLSGNKASITLPASCYVKTGPISIVIKISNSSNIITVGAFHTYVAESTTDTIIDPGHVIPSISELLAQIEAMKAGTTAANNAAKKLENMTASATRVDASSNAKATVTTVGSGSNAHYNIAFQIPQSPADSALSTTDIDDAIS